MFAQPAPEPFLDALFVPSALNVERSVGQVSPHLQHKVFGLGMGDDPTQTWEEFPY